MVAVFSMVCSLRLGICVPLMKVRETKNVIIYHHPRPWDIFYTMLQSIIKYFCLCMIGTGRFIQDILLLPLTQFSKPHVWQKYLKDRSFHLAWRHAGKIVLGHCLFLKVHSFPQGTLVENCSLLGTESDNVCREISKYYFWLFYCRV